MYSPFLFGWLPVRLVERARLFAAKSFFLLLFCIVFTANSKLHAADADGKPEEQAERNVFADVISGADTSTQTVFELIDQMEMMFPKFYGTIAVDSIKAVTLQFRHLQAENKFLIVPQAADFVSSTINFQTWLETVFKGAHTTGDSIELICKWIPQHFAYGDANDDYRNYSIDSLYNGIVSGTLAGDCNSYTVFMCKLARKYQHVWGWGAPVSIDGQATGKVPGVGKQPNHGWVGFARENGEIWCVADPTIGSIVRDAETGKSLSMDTISSWLKNPMLSKRVLVNPIQYSLQAVGPVIFAPNLRVSEGLKLFKTDGPVPYLAWGQWYTYLEKGSSGSLMVASCWQQAGFPENEVCNIYCFTTSGEFYGYDAKVADRLNARYGWPLSPYNGD